MTFLLLTRRLVWRKRGRYAASILGGACMITTCFFAYGLAGSYAEAGKTGLAETFVESRFSPFSEETEQTSRRISEALPHTFGHAALALFGVGLLLGVLSAYLGVEEKQDFITYSLAIGATGELDAFFLFEAVFVGLASLLLAMLGGGLLLFVYAEHFKIAFWTGFTLSIIYTAVSIFLQSLVASYLASERLTIRIPA